MSAALKPARRTALLGIFSAITVVLQLLSYFVKIGTFNLSLVLVPIVLSAVLFGPKFGGIIGGVFGAVVVIATVSGLDSGGFIMFDAAPVMTVFLCLFKGVAAGVCAGLAANLFKNKHPYFAAVVAAVVAPIVNSGIFVVCLLFFYRELLIDWAAGTNIAYYIVFGLVGVNFLIEMAINAVFSPIIYRLVRAVSKLHV